MAAGEQDSEGRYTGGLREGFLEGVQSGEIDVQQAMDEAGRKVRSSRTASASFLNQDFKIADSVMKRDDSLKTIVSMIEAFAERAGDPSDEMQTLLARKMLGIDTLRWEKMKAAADSFISDSDHEMRRQLEEMGTEGLAFRQKTGGTWAGITQGIKGTVSDFGAPGVALAEGVSAASQELSQDVEDWWNGVSRTRNTAGQMYRDLQYAGLQGGGASNLGVQGIDAGAWSEFTQGYNVRQGMANPSMFTEGLNRRYLAGRYFQDEGVGDKRRKILGDLAGSDEVAALLRKGLLSDDMSGVRGEIGDIVRTNLARGGVGVGSGGAADYNSSVDYLLSSSDEGSAMLAALEIEKGAQDNPFFSAGDTFEASLRRSLMGIGGTTERRQGSVLAGTASVPGGSFTALSGKGAGVLDFFNKEGSEGVTGLAAAAHRRGINLNQMMEDERIKIRMVSRGRGMSAEKAKELAAQQVMARLQEQGVDVGSATDLVSLTDKMAGFGAAEQEDIFGAVSRASVQRAFQAGREALRSAGEQTDPIADSGLAGGLHSFREALDTPGADLGEAFHGLLTGEANDTILGQSVLGKSLIKSRGRYRALQNEGTLSVEEYLKKYEGTASPDRIKAVRAEYGGTLDQGEATALFEDTEAAKFLTGAKASAGAVGISEKTLMTQQSNINEEVLANLKEITDRNRAQRLWMETVAGTADFAKPGNAGAKSGRRAPTANGEWSF